MQTVKLYCHRDTSHTRKLGGDAKTLSDLCVKIWGRTTGFNPISAIGNSNRFGVTSSALLFVQTMAQSKEER